MLFLLFLFLAALGAAVLFAAHLLPLLIAVGVIVFVVALCHRGFCYEPDRWFWHRDWPWHRDRDRGRDHRRW